MKIKLKNSEEMMKPLESAASAESELLISVEEAINMNHAKPDKGAAIWQNIPLGLQEDSATDLERLHCPYCYKTVLWNDFYYEVDEMDILSTDGTVVGTFTCPHCKKEMDVLLAVMVHAERKENNNESEHD